jgi:hypothetical protein
MNKDLKLIHNVLQCVLCNSSRCHYLEPLRKGVIAKMAYLAEFWLILESDLVERAPHMEYLLNRYETITQHTKDCTLTNTFGLTEFGSVMKKL